MAYVERGLDPRAMRSALVHDDAVEAAERAVDLARRVAGVDALEARADTRVSRRVAIGADGASATRLSIARGLGMTVTAGGATAFVHTTDLSDASIRGLIEDGAAVSRIRARFSRAPPPDPLVHRVEHVPRVRRDPARADDGEILDLLGRARAAAQGTPGIQEAHATFGVRSATTWVLDTRGSRSRIDSLVSTLYVTAVSRDGGRMGSGSARQAGERGLEDHETHGGPEALGLQAAARAIDSRRAVSVPSGRYRVLCDNELSGTLAHESFGHLTEYDLVGSGWSTLRGRRGETLAAEGVSVTDAPVVAHDPKQGVVVPFDDQGTRGEPVTVLEDGRLAAWLHSRETAAAVGEEAKGNGRALDSRFPAIVRMRNTYFEPGRATVEEALRALGDGLYLCGARGGAPHSDGSFMFTAIRGYLVKGGKLGEPVRNLAIHGNVFDFLRSVELTTRDFEVSTNYFGGCGKREQSFLHVGVGGPHVLVREALVGGV